MNNCLFCRLISREFPSAIVYEDDMVFAFLDIKPIRPGHVLIAPKKHCRGFHDLPEEQVGPFFERVQLLSKHLKASLPAAGMNLIQNEGAAAGQVIDHLHVHIIPRDLDDGLEPWHGSPYPDQQMMDDLAKRLRAAIQ